MLQFLRATWSPGVKACSNYRRYCRICSRFRNTLHTVVWAFLVHGWHVAQISEDCVGKPLRHCRLPCLTHGRPELLPVQRHPVVSNCWHHRRMLLSDGGGGGSTKLTSEYPLYRNYPNALRKLQDIKRFMLGSRHNVGSLVSGGS
jgi:hypothetical protein